MQTAYKAREITQEEIDELMSLTSDDITLDLLMDYFSNRADREARFNPNDRFRLPQNRLFNKRSIGTTVGRWLINLLILTPSVGKHIEFVNYPLNGKGLGRLEGEMSDLLLDDHITVTEFSEFIDKIQWLGFATTDFLNPSLTSSLLTAPESVKKRKEELLSQEDVKQAIKDGDIEKVIEVEQELLDLAQRELNDSPDMDIYRSGSRGSWSNNYKMTAISRGPIKSVSDPTEIGISMSSLEEGIPEEERHMYADILTQASFSRAIGTQEGGYEAKKLAASFQGVVFDEKGTDCNTSLTTTLEVTKANANLLTNRYIVEGKALKMLTKSNVNSYIGKFIDLRSPMYCASDHICNICAGELYHELGIENVGLVSNVIGTTITNLALKSFHDTSVTIVEIDPFDYIS